jgi:hypothetical protein
MANPKSARSLSSPKQRPEAAENKYTSINRGDARFPPPISHRQHKVRKLEQANAENHAILVV